VGVWNPGGVPIGFRRLERSDFSVVAAWLAAPHVTVWWRHRTSMADVEADFGPVVDGTDPTEVFVIEEDGQGIGIIQRYRFDDDPEWDRVMAVGSAPRPAIGLDYLIGVEDCTGKGLGGPIIAEFVDDSWDRFADIRAVVVEVHQANYRSWRVLEKAGFRRDWSGTIQSDDPSDEGPQHVYVRLRPTW
jgi:aminoglycoside 6'-N-acetyltransferase